MNPMNTDESTIRELVESWARAARARDYDGVLANHASEMLMFDVPPPFQSKGIEAYKQTWDLFFSSARDPIAFALDEVNITAGDDVAFISAVIHCSTGTSPLEVRLTMGLRKIQGKWVITHEHHSVPAT